MALSDEFIQSICSDELQRKILMILRNDALSDYEKTEVLLKYMKGELSA